MTSHQPQVAIFRRNFLAYSEHFILQQAQYLARYRPEFIAIDTTRPTLGSAGIPLRRPLHRAAGRMAGRRVENRIVHDWLLRQLTRRHYRLVHAHFGPDGSAVASYAERAGKPLVVTFHGYDATTAMSSWASSPTGREYAASLPELFQKSARLVAVSDFVADRLRVLGAPEDKLVVLRIGTDVTVAFIDPTERPTGMVLFVGRLAEVKGADVLLDAVSRIPERVRPSITLVGDGPERDALVARARDLSLNARFLGAQPHELAVSIMREATVLAVPSVPLGNGAAEGLGLAAAEAMACGLPVVATQSGGIPELVVDGVTGRTVPAGDATALAQALQELAEDTGLRRRLARKAREFVTAHFDVGTQTARLEELYDDVARE